MVLNLFRRKRFGAFHNKVMHIVNATQCTIDHIVSLEYLLASVGKELSVYSLNYLQALYMPLNSLYARHKQMIITLQEQQDRYKDYDYEIMVLLNVQLDEFKILLSLMDVKDPADAQGFKDITLATRKALAALDSSQTSIYSLLNKRW